MHVSTTDVIAGFSAAATAVLGAASWWNSDRANRLENRVQSERRAAREQKTTADLQQAEIAGWQTLIETTRNQYQQMVEQASSVQAKLDSALTTIRSMDQVADQYQDQIRDLTREVKLLNEQLTKDGNGSTG